MAVVESLMLENGFPRSETLLGRFRHFAIDLVKRTAPRPPPFGN
jgi:hypothetical protein